MTNSPFAFASPLGAEAASAAPASGSTMSGRRPRLVTWRASSSDDDDALAVHGIAARRRTATVRDGALDRTATCGRAVDAKERADIASSACVRLG